MVGYCSHAVCWWLIDDQETNNTNNWVYKSEWPTSNGWRIIIKMVHGTRWLGEYCHSSNVKCIWGNCKSHHLKQALPLSIFTKVAVHSSVLIVCTTSQKPQMRHKPVDFISQSRTSICSQHPHSHSATVTFYFSWQIIAKRCWNSQARRASWKSQRPTWTGDTSNRLTGQAMHRPATPSAVSKHSGHFHLTRCNPLQCMASWWVSMLHLFALPFESSSFMLRVLYVHFGFPKNNSKTLKHMAWNSYQKIHCIPRMKLSLSLSLVRCDPECYHCFLTF